MSSQNSNVCVLIEGSSYTNACVPVATFCDVIFTLFGVANNFAIDLLLVSILCIQLMLLCKSLLSADENIWLHPSLLHEKTSVSRNGRGDVRIPYPSIVC